MVKRLLRNVSYLIFAQVLVKIISFFYVLFLARNLGVNNFGLYSVALSYFTITSTLIDFGISRYLIKEATLNRKNLSFLISNIIVLRISSFLPVFTIFGALLYAFDPSKLRAELSLLAFLAVLPQSISLTLDNVFISLQKLSYSAIAMVLTNISITVFGVLLIYFGYGAFGGLIALILGQLINVVVLTIFLFKENLSMSGTVSFKIMHEVFLKSLPYGLLGFFGFVYFKVDVLILGYLKGSYETGIYGAGYKFLEAVNIIPSALSVTLFPALVVLHKENAGQIRYLSVRIIKIMGVLGILTALLFIMILPKIIEILLPSYLPSIFVIQILALSIPLMFIHVPLVQVLLSEEKYLKPLILAALIPLSFNIIANLLFIPLYGYVASAIVTVISDLVSLIVVIGAIYKYFIKENRG